MIEDERVVERVMRMGIEAKVIPQEELRDHAVKQLSVVKPKIVEKCSTGRFQSFQEYVDYCQDGLEQFYAMTYRSGCAEIVRVPRADVKNVRFLGWCEIGSLPVIQ